MKRLMLTSVLALMVASPAIAETATKSTAETSAKFMATSAGNMRASNWLGTSVKNRANETIGDVNDFLLSRDGKVAAVITGVGGFLGIGEKNVALPFETVEMRTDEDGNRVVSVMLSKAELESAPAFKVAGEKTMGDRMDDAKKKAGELYESTKKSASEAYKSAKEAVSEGYEATKEGAREAADEVGDAVSGRETKVTQ